MGPSSHFRHDPRARAPAPASGPPLLQVEPGSLQDTTHRLQLGRKSRDPRAEGALQGDDTGRGRRQGGGGGRDSLRVGSSFRAWGNPVTVPMRQLKAPGCPGRWALLPSMASDSPPIKCGMQPRVL